MKLHGQQALRGYQHPPAVSLWPSRGPFHPITGFLGRRNGFICLFIYFIIIFETGSCSEAQAGLGLTSSPLPQPPKCWNYRREPVCPASGVFLLRNGCKKLPGQEASPQLPLLCPSALPAAAYSFKHPEGSVAVFRAALSRHRSRRRDCGRVREKEYRFPTFSRGPRGKT